MENLYLRNPYENSQIWFGCGCIYCSGSEDDQVARFDWNSLPAKPFWESASPTVNEFGSVSYLTDDTEIDTLSYGLKWNPNKPRDHI